MVLVETAGWITVWHYSVSCCVTKSFCWVLSALWSSDQTSSCETKSTLRLSSVLFCTLALNTSPSQSLLILSSVSPFRTVVPFQFILLQLTKLEPFHLAYTIFWWRVAKLEEEGIYLFRFPLIEEFPLLYSQDGLVLAGRAVEPWPLLPMFPHQPPLPPQLIFDHMIMMADSLPTGLLALTDSILAMGLRQELFGIFYFRWYE